MTSTTDTSVGLIKRSIALRAKYRLEQGPTPTIKTFPASLAVPHPQNRGGDPVKSIRTKQLSGEIARDGCDGLEANSSAVAVEDDPTKPQFQLLFEEQIKSDPDMAVKIANIRATVGTLSHGHFNCTMRNQLAGKSGCECTSTVVEEGTSKSNRECKCLNKPILDKDGCYSMELIKAHDLDWATLIEKGIKWEL